MSKGTKTLLIVVAVILVIGIGVYSFFAGNYNSMVNKEEAVKSQWAQVENVYQRRLDLVPNLVATVRGAASHEAAVLTQVTEARAKAGGVMNVSDEILNDPEAFRRFQQAQNELGSALQRLLVVTENYPDLKVNENFLTLQSQLEGTENRIAVERNRYNTVVQDYNSFIRNFPRSIIANMNGFTQKAYFTADEGAQRAPTVSFE
ncbi:LemA family protein [Brucepastera parasyntrophica]|uniref:LemA family protein n=1 Tax=Brucepastera parasyntrophica TaxID=2880008 RepID=UPI00210A9F64|nr:LemA family protein [Brucepastera parasyntrophica]ULQ60240.1 LemA family protein [Brucepastera parasyntrophica]